MKTSLWIHEGGVGDLHSLITIEKKLIEAKQKIGL